MKQKRVSLYPKVVLGSIAALAVAVYVLLMFANAPQVLASPPTQSPDDGKKLYAEKCSACHTIGQGNRAGPDLKGVTEQRDLDWLARWIANPDQLIAQKDPIATELLQKFNNVPMPNQGLSKSQVDSIIAYLQSDSAGSASPAGGQPLPPGDLASGKRLFSGAARFSGGGPTCIACHSVAGIGALGGGALGPDLTGAFVKYGGTEGLAAFLEGVPTLAMNAVWSQKPLTVQERADVVAYLQQAGQAQKSASPVGILIISALAGAGALLLLANLIWWKRHQGIHKDLS